MLIRTVSEDQNKSTREKVLQTLLSRQRCTINELAEAVDINPISVRHHIARLEAEGLVTSEEERHGVGRPRRLYYLTEGGLEHFPSRYMKLTIRLLEQLKDTMPQSMVSQLFTQMAEGMAAEVQAEAQDLSLEQRLTLVTGLLSQEGFTVEWEKQGSKYLIPRDQLPVLSRRAIPPGNLLDGPNPDLHRAGGAGGKSALRAQRRRPLHLCCGAGQLIGEFV